MNCMKCGRETTSEQVFCDECQLEMQKYPVKPGTVVLLPRRRDQAAQKKASKKKIIPLEEQVRTLKRQVFTLMVLLIISSALILVMLYPSVQFLMEDNFKIGQNYTTITAETLPPVTTTRR